MTKKQPHSQTTKSLKNKIFEQYNILPEKLMQIGIDQFENIETGDTYRIFKKYIIEKPASSKVKVSIHFNIPRNELVKIGTDPRIEQFKHTKTGKIYCWDKDFKRFICNRTPYEWLKLLININPEMYIKIVNGLFTILSLVLNIISICAGILFLSHLGWIFDLDTIEYDWKLVCIQIICWIILSVNIIILLGILKEFSKPPLLFSIPVLINIFSSSVGIYYTRDPNNDWKRKYLIILSWYMILGSLFSIINMAAIFIDLPLGFVGIKFPIAFAP